METCTIAQPAMFPDAEQIRSVRQAVENVIDYDIVVDDCRRDVDRAVDRLRTAVAERDRAADVLASIVRDVPVEECHGV